LDDYIGIKLSFLDYLKYLSWFNHRKKMKRINEENESALIVLSGVQKDIENLNLRKTLRNFMPTRR
jgi:hypothetical protein